MNQRGFSNILIGIIVAVILIGAGGTFLVSKRLGIQKEEIAVGVEKIPPQPLSSLQHSPPPSSLEKTPTLPPAVDKKKEIVVPQKSPAFELPSAGKTYEKLGNLCTGRNECISYCSNNRAGCEDYCKGKRIELCRIIFPEKSTEEKAPVLKNLGVSFEPWDKNTNKAGAFVFLQTEDKVFLEYGVEVGSSEGGTKILPTFEYRVAKDADVFAAIDGIVTQVTYKESTQDNSILIQPDIGSQWFLGHDHVSSPKVSRGDRVNAGDILGKAGTFSGDLGRTEIMFWRSSTDSSATYCPFKYFDPQLLSEYQQKIARHMKDWEEFKGNPNIYSEEKHIFPGCVYESLID